MTTMPEYTADQLRYKKAIDFVRWLRCLVKSDNSPIGAWSLFEEFFPRSITLATKVAVNPATVTDTAWGAPLAQFAPPQQQAVVELIRAAGVLGQMQAGIRRVPFQTSAAAQISGGTFSWVGEGAPAPVSNLQLTSANVGMAKTVGIIVISKELALTASGIAERTSLNDIVRGSAEFLDKQLLDPTVTATSVSPGSILATAPSIGATGTSAAAALTDTKSLVRAFFSVNADALAPYWVMSPGNACAFAAALSVPNLTSLFDIPVIKSTAAGARVAIIDAGQLLFADDDSLEVSLSQQALVEFNTVPTSPITAASVYVNLWQAGLLGIRVGRTINWRLARPQAAVYLNGSYV